MLETSCFFVHYPICYFTFKLTIPLKAMAHHLPGSYSIHTLLDCRRLALIFVPFCSCVTIENSTPGPLRTFKNSDNTSKDKFGKATASVNWSVEVVSVVSSSLPVLKKGRGST